MAIEPKVGPTGTGQQGSGTAPAGAEKDIPVHLEGEPVDNLDRIADHAAHKGIDRQHREDPTIFSK